MTLSNMGYRGVKSIYGVALLCLTAISVYSQGINFLEAAPPDRPGSEVWTGIDEAQKNVPTEKNSNSYTGRVVNLLSSTPPPAEEGYFIILPLRIPKTSDYELWIACSKIGATFASSIQCYLDGVEISPEMPIQHGNKAWGPANAISWNRFSTLNLNAGDHELKIVVRSARKLDSKYSIVMDAVALMDKNASSNVK